MALQRAPCQTAKVTGSTRGRPPESRYPSRPTRAERTSARAHGSRSSRSTTRSVRPGEEPPVDIGIGLPSTIPGVEGRQITEWARRGEAAGFSSLGTIDRLVYPNYEPLIALAAAAAVTERIRLMTAILLAPLRTNDALLAKQAASLQDLSGGRLVLGMAPGGREDDYEAS